MTLYELTEAYKQLLAMAEDEETDGIALKDTFDALNGSIEEKAEGYAIVMKELDAEIEKLKKEEERLHNRRKAIESHKDILMSNLTKAMKVMGKTKFKTEHFSFAIVKNGGYAPVVVTKDIMYIPDDLKVISEKIDTRKLYEYIQKTGDTSYGFIGERGESLRIK